MTANGLFGWRCPFSVMYYHTTRRQRVHHVIAIVFLPPALAFILTYPWYKTGVTFGAMLLIYALSFFITIYGGAYLITRKEW